MEGEQSPLLTKNLASAVVIVLGVLSIQLYQQYHPVQNPRDEPKDFIQLQNAQPPMAFCRKDPPLLCSHGGSSHAAAANTLPALTATLKAGADCIEVDVALTRDGQLVCVHARQLHAWTGQLDMEVGTMTFAEMSALRGPSNESVPLLEQVVIELHARVTRLILDIKLREERRGRHDKMANLVLAVLRQTQCRSCLLWCKDDSIISHLAALGVPPSQLGYIALPDETSRPKVVQEKAEVIGAHFSLVDKEFVSWAEQHSKEVYAWTVNSATVMGAVLDVGPRAIVTDNFDALQHVVAAWKQTCNNAEL